MPIEKAVVPVHPYQGWSDQLAQAAWEKLCSTKFSGQALKAARYFDPSAHTPVLPFLIDVDEMLRPYNKAIGYFTYKHGSKSPIIVSAMPSNRYLVSDLKWKLFIAHELCHWLQHEIAGHMVTKPVHEVPSWKLACMLMFEVLTGVAKPYEYFITTTSVHDKVTGRKVKCAKPGSLTQSELTHFPESLIVSADQLVAPFK